MKYIRLKYDICEITNEDEKILSYENERVCGCLWKDDYKDQLQCADIIDKLCDGLIVEDKDNTNNWFVMEISEYQSKDNVDKKYMVDRWNFYAFIKIDKGLIYVAKMNDKGELELL